jgi:hypothetical protein
LHACRSTLEDPPPEREELEEFLSQATVLLQAIRTAIGFEQHSPGSS